MDHLCHKTEAKLLEDDLKSLKKLSMKQQQQEQQSVDQRVESMEIDNGTTTTMTEVVKVKSEKLDSAEDTAENAEIEEKRPKKHPVPEEHNEIVELQPPAKVWKGLRYKTWSMGIMQPASKFKKPADREITEVNKMRTHIISLSNKLLNNSSRL